MSWGCCMNDNDFVLAADGWSQITPCGEFPHAGAGAVQVIPLHSEAGSV